MALQFVLGNSGSGKTEYIYEKIVKEAALLPKKNFLVVVPEQFTMQTQKKLVELSENHAIMNIDVLSFKRLAYRVFDDLGMSELSVLEETGKNLVLRKIAKQKEEELTVLRPNIARMGYIEELKSLISEMVQYNISPSDLKEHALSLRTSPAFSQKLLDIATIYEGFSEYMRGNYVTAEEILNVLIDVAGDSELLKNSVVVFDEFTGFTPIQNRLLQTILPLVEKMYVLLTIDAQEDFYHCNGEHELFYLSKKTISSLLKMAEVARVEVADPVILSGSEKKRYENAPDLAFMEKNLFRRWYRKKTGEVQNIRISCERNPLEEITYVSREITRLVREEHFRYRDIAVVSGAVEGYKSNLTECFEKYEIPYFMDQTTEVLFHPFIECIRAALEIVSSNFSYESVMRFLRTGFVDIEERHIDLLDNYLVAIRVRGKNAWKKRWLRKMKDERMCDLELLDQLRIQIADLLIPFYETFEKKSTTVSDKIMALYQLLVSLHAEEKLWIKEEEYLKEGQQDKSKEYGQIYRIVMELLEKYDTLLGAEQISVEEFTEILDAGLSAANVAVIPPGYDSVTLGDIERTRLNGVKVLFFVGVNDGIIPKAVGKGGIISEYERQMLKEAKLELAPGAREQAFIQRFYLYRNLTKPTQLLYLSYVKVDGEGKAIRPSYLIETIKRMFPDLVEQDMEEIFSVPNFYTAEAAKDYLVHGRKDENWYALAGLLLEGEDAEQLNRLISAPFSKYTPDPISKAVAQAIYGKSLKGSVTRLEKYAVCAYKHFLEYGLKLKERELASFENTDMGNLYHDALKRYSDKLEESEYDWFKVPEEARIQLCQEAMEEALLAYPNLTAYATCEDLHMTKRMQGIFEQTVWALTEQVRAGRFIPTEFEISFSEMENLNTLKLSFGADEHMQLLGRIDRFDTAEDDDKLYVKIIDYKSGNTKFDLIRIYQGLSLQLVVYLSAGMEYAREKYPSKTIIPGAVLYYHIDDPVIDVSSDISTDSEEYRHELLAALMPDGLVNSQESVYRSMDEKFEKRSEVIPVAINKSGELSATSKVASSGEFEILEEYVKNQMLYQGKQIFSGNVAINPYKDGQNVSCSYCPYESVCGFDKNIPGFGYRKLPEMKKNEVIEKMQLENAKSS